MIMTRFFSVLSNVLIFGQQRVSKAEEVQTARFVHSSGGENDIKGSLEADGLAEEHTV
jgi:hypothetical protein